MLIKIYKKVSQIPVVSVGRSAWRFAYRGYESQPHRYRRKQQWKSFFYAVFNAGFAKKWFEIINAPEYELITAQRKLLYFKPFRVYMSVKWSKAKKTKVILDTYKFIYKHNGAFIGIIESNQVFEIADFKLHDSTQGKLILWYEDRYRKEGELLLSFVCEELGGMIVTASFSFEELSIDNWICRIGCIQGHSSNGENATKMAQKLLHGLRPKALIVFAIQEFSKHLGFSGVYGAGDDIQAYRQKHLIHLPGRHDINFNYNAIWTECGGELAMDGWYKLPLSQVPKNMEDISSNKRSQYRKRYTLLDELSLKITDAVKRLSVDST